MGRIVLTTLILTSVLWACGAVDEGGGDSGIVADVALDGDVGTDATDVGAPGDVRPLEDAGDDGSDGLDVTDVTDTTDAGEPGDGENGSDGGDGGDSGEPADVGDAGDVQDAIDPTDPSVCECDLTAFCEAECACDIACRGVIGARPLGAESIGLERNEIAVFDATADAVSVNRVSLYDDAIRGSYLGNPRMGGELISDWSVPYVSDSGLRPMGLSADVDDDGRDEAILVTSTAVFVVDWDGASVGRRLVYSYAAADWFDAAVGDLDHDGGRDLVVSRQVGDAVTVDVIDIRGAGSASVRASLDVPRVARHAIAVGAAFAGDRPLLHVLTTQPIEAFAEPVELTQFALEGATLVEERRLELEPICSFGFGARTPDDGVTLLVGDMTSSPGNEFFIAAFCGDGDFGQPVQGSLHDQTGARTLFGRVGPESLNYTYARAGRVRPQATMGYFDPLPGEPGVLRYLRPVVALPVVGGEALLITLNLNFPGRPGFDDRRVDQRVGTDVVIAGVAARDLDGDGIDEVIASFSPVSNACGAAFPCYQSSGATVMAFHRDSRRNAVVDEVTRTGSLLDGPILAVGDFDQDSMRVRSTGNVFRYVSGATINAVVAAPPTWMRDGVTQADGSETTFGEAESTSEANGGLLSYGGSLTVGAGVSLYKVVELYAYLTASFGVTHDWTFEESVTLAQALSAGADADLVSYSRAIYVSYEYEVVSHPDRELIGQRLTIDEVDSVVQSTVSLDRFRATVANADALVPPGLLAHAVGRPDSYGRPGTCNPADLQAQVGSGAVTAVYESGSLTDVGDAPSGYRSMSVDVATQTEEGVEAVFEVGAQVGGAIGLGGSVTAYVGGGYAYRKTIGSSATYAGSVGVISEGYSLDTRFQWGLCVYHWADREENPTFASYPIVTYVVQRY